MSVVQATQRVKTIVRTAVRHVICSLIVSLATRETGLPCRATVKVAPTGIASWSGFARAKGFRLSRSPSRGNRTHLPPSSPSSSHSPEVDLLACDARHVLATNGRRSDCVARGRVSHLGGCLAHVMTCCGRGTREGQIAAAGEAKQTLFFFLQRIPVGPTLSRSLIGIGTGKSNCCCSGDRQNLHTT